MPAQPQTKAKGLPAKGLPAKGLPAKGLPAKGLPAKGLPRPLSHTTLANAVSKAVLAPDATFVAHPTLANAAVCKSQKKTR